MSQFNAPRHTWIPLTTSLSFLLKNKKLLGWSVMLVLVTMVLTWLGFLLTTNLFDSLTASFFNNQPATESIWGWIKYSGWISAKWLFLLVSRIVAFFLAFLAAYSLSAPLYVFLSTSTEKIHQGREFETDDGFTVSGVLFDLFEGFKIGAFGIIVTVVALFISFIPIIGQIGVFLLYTYYSALMFVDYPASRRRWSLSRKLKWLQVNSNISFRIGLFPAFISMIPFLNMFFMALIFPLFTVHATLNFIAAHKTNSPPPSNGTPT